MAKRNWPEHIAVGRTINYGGVPVTVVDVKAGPMMFNRSDLEKKDLKFIGTLKLRVKHQNGREEWLPTMEGQPLVDWCEKQDAALEHEAGND
jgi:hypothetical protein